MVVCAYNPALGRQAQEDSEFEADVGYIVRPCLKKNAKKTKKPSTSKERFHTHTRTR
jgi:hypothetical protein